MFDLRNLKNRSHLARFIGIKPELVDEVINIPSNWPKAFNSATDQFYSGSFPGVELLRDAAAANGLFHINRIPKKNKKRGFREVTIASDRLSDAYKSLSRKLTIFFGKQIPDFPHSSSFGYARGRGTRDNARVHLGANHLVKMDIEAFFPSITSDMVQELFVGLGVDQGVSRDLSRFLTIGQALPLGIATSSVISNAIFHTLDVELASIAKAFDVKYSRYVDDITFSSASEIDLNIISEATRVIEARGFRVAEDKTRWQKRGQNFYVTGLSVSESDAPHCPRSMKREIRKILYYAHKFGLKEHARNIGIKSPREFQCYINKIDGTVKYVSFHEPKQAEKIRKSWNAALKKSSSAPFFEFRERFSSPITMYFDEAQFSRDGVEYLALCTSVSSEQEVIDREISCIIENKIADPFFDGNKCTLSKKGMHFCDCNEDLKRTFIEMMALLPFRAYIAFAKLDNSSYENTYLQLLRSMLKRRLVSAHSRSVLIRFEENSKVSKVKLKDEIQNCWDAIKKSDDRYPSTISFGVVSKASRGVGIPDFVLGAFQRYYAPKDGPMLRHDLMFEQIRDKVRVIFDVEDGLEHTRRNPISRT